MGLRDKYAKRVAEQGFRPLELNEDNVQAIFNRCLATEEEKCSFMKHRALQVLKPLLTGKTSAEVYLSTEKIGENQKNIEFLFGQIKNIHYNNSAIGLQEGFITYQDTVWTREVENLLKLYALAQSKGLITEFSALPTDPNIISAIKASDVRPTLSPKDPAFPAWWEQHRAEWEK